MLSEETVKELKEEYDRMNSPESKEYTEKILLEMGKEIQRRFPGVDFILKARFKSPKSHQGKIDRFMKKDVKSDKQIYDTIGFCLIVRSVSDNFEFNHALCEMSVEDRVNIGLEIDNEKSSLRLLEKEYQSIMEEYNKLYDVNAIRKKIEDLKKSDEPDEEMIQLLENSLKGQELIKSLAERLINEVDKKGKKVIKIGNQYYEATDNKINEMIATHIMNKLTNDETFMQSLNLKTLDNRKKFHDGGKSGYYRAYHDAIGSTEHPWWKAEVQALSYQNYVNSKEGDAKHSSCEGKTRRFPRIGTTEEEKEDFRKAVLEASPRNLVYQSGVYKNGEEKRPGKTYVCSDVENILYYYLEVLRDKPELFKYVISDKELFSDESRTVE